MTKLEYDVKQLKIKFAKELVEKRCANMKEDKNTATIYIKKWIKEDPKSFNFLFNCWYKEFINKIGE